MLSDLWQWLHDTSPVQATFIGSVFGFLALLGGALFNAWLNRRRDDRLRREEQRTVATALRAELAGCRRALLTNVELLNQDRRTGTFLMPDLVQAILIMPHMIPKFGLLDEETIDKVTNAYLAVQQHSEQLLLEVGVRLVDPERVSAGEAQPAGETRATGSRRLMSFSPDKAPQLIAINSQHAEAIQEAAPHRREDEGGPQRRGGARGGMRWLWV
jgi:hypothetical protein